MNVYVREKIITMHDLIARRATWARYKKIGLAHGCFDVLTPAHIKFLIDASMLCDTLIVSVSSDKVARELKGEGRPVFSAEDRMIHIACLEPVDFVVRCDQTDASDLIKAISPVSLLKGHDSVESTAPGFIRERSEANQNGGQVIYVVAGAQNHSTELLAHPQHTDLFSDLSE